MLGIISLINCFSLNRMLYELIVFSFDDSGSEIKILSKWIRNRVLVLDNKFPEIDTVAKYEKMLVSINTSVNMPFVLVLDGINEMKNPHLLLKEN